jgi:hypothetical protein
MVNDILCLLSERSEREDKSVLSIELGLWQSQQAKIMPRRVHDFGQLVMAGTWREIRDRNVFERKGEDGLNTKYFFRCA